MTTFSYTQYRTQFKSVAKGAGAEITSYFYDGYGPNAEILAIDVAVIGNAEAPKTVVTTSGVHGVELPYGSFLQRQWMAEAKRICSRRSNVRFVFVHGLNPYGAAYGERNDKNNIDLSRNFIDFNAPLPSSEKYKPLADAFAPMGLDSSSLWRAWGKIGEYIINRGISDFKQALAGGQYEFQNGLYYGGKEPSWSRDKWEEIVLNHVLYDGLCDLWHIDLHTGEGDYGQMQMMVGGNKDSDVYKRAKKTDPGNYVRETGTIFAKLSGDITDYWPRLISDDITVTPIALELGTSKRLMLDVLDIMIKRVALTQRHKDSHPDREEIIAAMREMFNPSDIEWRKSADKQTEQFWRKFISVVAPGR